MARISVLPVWLFLIRPYLNESGASAGVWRCGFFLFLGIVYPARLSKLDGHSIRVSTPKKNGDALAFM